MYFLILCWPENKNQKDKWTSDSESKKPGMSLELVELETERDKHAFNLRNFHFLLRNGQTFLNALTLPVQSWASGKKKEVKTVASVTT